MVVLVMVDFRDCGGVALEDFCNVSEVSEKLCERAQDILCTLSHAMQSASRLHNRAVLVSLAPEKVNVTPAKSNTQVIIYGAKKNNDLYDSLPGLVQEVSVKTMAVKVSYRSETQRMRREGVIPEGWPRPLWNDR